MLVNTAGPHADRKTPVIESIPPVGPLEVALRTAKAPARITLEPGAQALRFERRDGVVRVTVPKVEIHRVVLVE